MSGRLIEVSLRVRDLARSVEFYRDLLGIPIGPGDDSGSHYEAYWGEWEPGRSDMLMLLLHPADDTHPPSLSEIGFSVEDLEAVHAAIVKAGGTVVSEPALKPWGVQATYRDPDGNNVAVAQTPR